MKRVIIFLISLVAVLSMQAQTGNAMYVYRNDGGFNAFLREDIDSICLSCYDLDSIQQQYYVCQVFYTSDSIYRIPIEAIDSVAFVPLPTVVNKTVFPLTAEHNPYIMRGDTLSFEMGINTPVNLLPAKGNIVVSSVDCNSFEDGIIARIISVKKGNDAIYFNCEKAYIDDIFDQILYHGALQQNSSQTRASVTISDVLWNRSYDETLSKGGTIANIHADDIADYKITLRKVLGQPLYAQIQLNNSFDSNLDFNAHAEYGNYYQKQIGKFRGGKISVPIPNIPPILWFVPTFDFYGYFADEGEINIDFKAHLNRSDKVCMTYEQGTWTISHTPLTDAAIDVASLSMKGYAEVGVITDILLALCGSKTGVGVTAEVGVKESIDFKFDALNYFDNGVYDALKDSYARTTIPWSISAFAQLGFAKESHRGTLPVVKKEHQLGNDKYLFPLFSEVTYEKGVTNGISVFTTEPSRDLLLPVELGFVIEEKDGDVVSTKWNSVPYKNQSLWTLNSLSESFSDLKQGKTYLASPCIRIQGKEIKASPSKEFCLSDAICPDDNHPHMIDLGLPSGAKWSCCNIDAHSPEGTGGYYAWGETYAKDFHSHTNYSLWNDVDGDGWFELESGECLVNYDIQGSIYDAAYVKSKGEWMLPSRSDFDELKNFCKYSFINYNNVAGAMLEGANGNRIFLPATGYSRSYSGGLVSSGTMGFYWSSTPHEEDDSATFFAFYSDAVALSTWNSRYYGTNIRPIAK